MRGKVLFVSLVSILLGVCNVMADVVIIHPSDDAYVDSTSPDANLGSQDQIYVSQELFGGGIKRGYLKFDLSSVPAGLKVASARLRLDCSHRRGLDILVGAHYLQDDAWDEATVTWNSAPTGSDANAADTVTIASGDNIWTVTQDVFGAYNTDGVYSVVIRLQDESRRLGAILWSKEAADSNSWPYLEVTHVQEYSGGSGTDELPYLIATPEDLNDIGRHAEDWGKHFLMVDDINLAGFSGTQFNIIGYYEGYGSPNNLPFTGVFDGNDHSISNLTYDSTDVDCIGLFAHVGGPNAAIRNVILADCHVHAGTGQSVGGLVGLISEGSIEYCRLQGGSVSGHADVGGLVGCNYEGSIANCYASGSSAGRSAGGLVGCNYEGPIANCYASGSSAGWDVGGLVGYNGNGVIVRCYSTGHVSGSGYWQGGLVGVGGGAVMSSYWDTETSGQSTSCGGQGKTTAEMKTASTYIRMGSMRQRGSLDD
jgi:hypothetical protein